MTIATSCHVKIQQARKTILLEAFGVGEMRQDLLEEVIKLVARWDKVLTVHDMHVW